MPQYFVVLISRADLPFVVREVGADNCCLIRDAYVHGSMHGEASVGHRVSDLYICNKLSGT